MWNPLTFSGELHSSIVQVISELTYWHPLFLLLLVDDVIIIIFDNMEDIPCNITLHRNPS